MKSFWNLILFAVSGLASAGAQTTFPALLADAPASEYRSQLMLFGHFVGDWKFSGVEYQPDGSRVTDEGDISFRWILGGRGIQDVWRESFRSDGDVRVYGTTLRVYDPKSDVWHINWTDPPNGSQQLLNTRSVGSEIVMEGDTANGTPLRWIFSNISRDSFRWRAEKLVNGKWEITEECKPHRVKRLEPRANGN